MLRVLKSGFSGSNVRQLIFRGYLMLFSIKEKTLNGNCNQNYCVISFHIQKYENTITALD